MRWANPHLMAPPVKGTENSMTTARTAPNISGAMGVRRLFSAIQHFHGRRRASGHTGTQHEHTEGQGACREHLDEDALSFVGVQIELDSDAKRARRQAMDDRCCGYPTDHLRGCYHCSINAGSVGVAVYTVCQREQA
jgi:hypothetical protein